MFIDRVAELTLWIVSSIKDKFSNAHGPPALHSVSTSFHSFGCIPLVFCVIINCKASILGPIPKPSWSAKQPSTHQEQHLSTSLFVRPRNPPRPKADIGPPDNATVRCCLTQYYRSPTLQYCILINHRRAFFYVNFRPGELFMMRLSIDTIVAPQLPCKYHGESFLDYTCLHGTSEGSCCWAVSHESE